MVIKKALFFHLLFISLFCAIDFESQAQEKSRVQFFQYGGFGDNMFATVQGRILYPIKRINQPDTLLPLVNVKIISFDSTRRIFKTTSSNKDGFFLIEFPYGKYSLEFSKPSYEAIFTTNYFSYGDQVSSLEIILEKGGVKQYFKLPDWGNK